MKPTTIMTRAAWIGGTSAVFTRGRSSGAGATLEAVDNALLMFESCTNNQWPECLRVLRDALNDWVASKTVGGKLKTARSHTKIAELRSQIDAALKGRDPEMWSGDYTPIFISTDVHKGNVEVPTAWKGRVDTVMGDLNKNDRGKQLLEMLTDECVRKKQRVVIAYGDNQCAPCTLETIMDNEKRLRPDVKAWLANPNIVQVGIDKSGPKRKFIGNTGSSALVLFDPDKPAGPDGERPAWIALGHELVHAYHYVTGTCARPLAGSTDTDSGLSEEEMQTVGTRGYQRQVPSENWLREGNGDPDRTKYSGYDFSATRCTLATG